MPEKERSATRFSAHVKVDIHYVKELKMMEDKTHKFESVYTEKDEKDEAGAIQLPSPYVEVQVDGHTVQRTATLSPTTAGPFNVFFTFNMKDISMREYFHKTVEIRVKHERKVISLTGVNISGDDFIGSTVLSLRKIYNRPLGCLMRAWRPLILPGHLEQGIHGFIQVSVAVMGLTDTVPAESVADHASQKRKITRLQELVIASQMGEGVIRNPYNVLKKNLKNISGT